jgi:uncharacterized protein YndB with AHSA1/START domain
MPIPNTISRTLALPHPQEKVWSALTTNAGLASWFGNTVEGELAPGSDVVMSWDAGHVARLAIKVVAPMSVFAYCWQVHGVPDEDPRRTYVEFVLSPTDAGTELTVTESGFAQLPDEWLSSYKGNVSGWTSELGELATYLDAA